MRPTSPLYSLIFNLYASFKLEETSLIPSNCITSQEQVSAFFWFLGRVQFKGSIYVYKAFKYTLRYLNPAKTRMIHVFA